MSCVVPTNFVGTPVAWIEHALGLLVENPFGPVVQDDAVIDGVRRSLVERAAEGLADLGAVLGMHAAIERRD